MVYKQKHIDLPMSLSDLKLRQGGRYARSYFDVNGYNLTVFSNFPHSRRKDILSPGHRLGFMHGSKDDNAHLSIYRSIFSACSRRLPSLFCRLSLGHQQTPAHPDTDTGQTLLSDRYYYGFPRRYTVPSQRKKNQRCRLLAGCRSLDKKEHFLCVGTESCGPDIADTTAMGRRTTGTACKYETASKERPHPDRTGRCNGQSTLSMTAGQWDSAVKA